MTRHSDAQVCRVVRILATWLEAEPHRSLWLAHSTRGEWHASVGSIFESEPAYESHGVTAVDALAQIATAIACEAAL